MKPKFTARLKTAINTFRNVNKNNGSLREARQFLKYGNGKTVVPNWSQVIMSDEDTYTGFMYGAINIRAVTVTQLATNNINTEVNEKTTEINKKNDEYLKHPYLELIDKSKTFSNYQFWYTISTHLDLEGLSYVMAVRAVSDSGMVGKVQEFKLLNPYNIQRIFDPKTKLLIGYKEFRGGSSRDIPKELIIPIINLNPFDESPLSMSDAAKDSQFTLKTAGDYTRSAIANNINAPGIIATDRELEGEDLANFKSRIQSHDKGEPLFGGGAGAITWNDMQQDLNKAALKEVNAISLQNIIAASGASKTMLGWEESGTTRDTATIQKDNFIELRAMPQLQLIIDALNQDYKNYYFNEYEKTEITIAVENPLATDLNEEKSMIDNRVANFDLYNALVNKGYDRELASKYTYGDITLVELGEPTNEPIMPTFLPTQTDSSVGNSKDEDKIEKQDVKDKEIQLQQAEKGLLNQTQASLQNSIINIDNRLLAEVIKRVGEVKNDFEDEEDLIGPRTKKQLLDELQIALQTFYAIILPLWAYNHLSKRLEQYGKSTIFKMNNEVKRFIKVTAKKASESHITTLLDSMIKQAQKDALAGLGRDKVARNLLNKYGSEITNSRAVTIARTETNRAFTMSQYQADKQFLKDNDLGGQAYKQWVTRSGNPCPFCLELESMPPIPFNEPFAEVGDELSATTEIDGKTEIRKMTIGFLDAEAGNAHPNCSCEYELIIE